MGPDIAIAASTRLWSGRLHRYLLDHGGATVKTRVMSPEQAVVGVFDVLLIDDICSFLTPRLVVDLRRGGKTVIGVFAPDDGPDAKRRLLEVGISDVIESEASPSEFLDQLIAVGSHADLTRANLLESQPAGFCLVVTGPPGGVGVTEIALGLGTSLDQRPVALIDLNMEWPSLGQRLGLPVHPNLRTAIDLVLHEPDRMNQSFHSLHGLNVISGLVNPDSGLPPLSDVATLISELAVMHDLVIVDLGPVGDSSQLILRRADAALVVGLGDPVGVTRLIKAYQRVAPHVRNSEAGIVVNRCASNHQKGQVAAQLKRALGEVPVFLIPEDSGIASAAWDGTTLQRGQFARAIKRLAGLFEDVAVAR